MFRGWVERMKYQLILDKEYHYNIYIPTVIFLQAIMRGFLCRKHYSEMVAQINVRKLSYFFEFYINYIFYPFMIKKESSDTFIGKIQSIVPINYYNN